MVNIVDKYLKSNWFLFTVTVFAISRIIMYYQFSLANTVILHNHGTFANAMCKWDCKWYLTIIESGYDHGLRIKPQIWKGLANWAFFPLYPNLIAIISKVTNLDTVNVGIIFNQICIFIAVIFFYCFLRLTFDDLNSRFGVVLLTFSPFSVYFASLYTEALFIMLSIIGFYYLKTNRGYITGLLGGLLSATRPVGMMFCIPIFINFIRKNRPIKELLITLCLSISGLVIFMMFLHFRAGDFLAFDHIQKGWGRAGWNFLHLSKQLWKMGMDFHNSIVFIISVLLSLYMLFRRYFEEAMFNFACILPGVMTGTMMSEGRFCGTLFTFYFGAVVLAEKSWTIKVIILILSIVLYMSYYIYWIGHVNFLI